MTNEYARGRRAGLEEAAKLADEFARANIEVIEGRIDCLMRALDKEGDAALSEIISDKEFQEQQAINRSMARAAAGLAADIRKLLEVATP
jgi:hypothetical protein